MAGISIKDYKFNILQKQYNNLSAHIYNLQLHIENCQFLGVISDRNIYLKQLNDIILNMNDQYNLHMTNINNPKELHQTSTNNYGLLTTISKSHSKANHKLKSKSNQDLDIVTNLNPQVNAVKPTIYEDIHRLVSLYGIIDNTNNITDGLVVEPFSSIIADLLKITEKVGFKCINDGLELIISFYYNHFYTSKKIELLSFYNKVFIPLQFTISKIDPSPENNINNLVDIYFNKIESKYESLVEICAELHIVNELDSSQKIIFTGYFIPDSVSVICRTSQICNNFIYQKKKELETSVKSIKNINDKFKKLYIRNLSIGDILLFDANSIKLQIDSDYKFHSELIKSSFVSLMQEFTSNTIHRMHLMIKLLLIGSNDSANIAGLLFGLTKDKKIGTDYIANIIYRNLNLHAQLKLKKTVVNIKVELDKIKSLTIDDIDLKKQLVLCHNMPLNAKRAVLEKIEEMKSSNNEYHKQLLYVRTLLNYPWPKPEDDVFFRDLGKDKSKSKEFIEKSIAVLDKKVWGHKECKEEIQELIGKWMTNPESSGEAIGLVGPPGVGKTLIAKALGDALGIPFVQITLGGQNDGELLHGHGYTYSGAQPGIIVKKMLEAGSSRCVMYLDELDKACKKHDSNEIFNILIHMIDPNTNTEFQDRFFQEITFPLNKVIFVFSYNDSSMLDPILRDRIKEIDVKPYSSPDKIKISQMFLINEICKDIGFDSTSITISEKTIDHIIENYTYEAGVRTLRRKLNKIFLKLNIDKLYQRGVYDSDDFKKTNQIELTEDLVETCLKKPNSSIRKIHSTNIPGIVNGLFATTSGKGGIIPIQIYPNYTGTTKKFILKLTGSQGKDMQESVSYAFTTTMTILSEKNRNAVFKNFPYGLHIHTPEACTPKDGPSAGGAFVLAFVSRLLNKSIKHDISITGEIELTGSISPIGGLFYKLYGSKKAGVTKVFIPKENESDLNKIRDENKLLFNENFTAVIVENIIDVLSDVLIDFDVNDFDKCVYPPAKNENKNKKSNRNK
jgi:endopeptidase La